MNLIAAAATVLKELETWLPLSEAYVWMVLLSVRVI